MKSLVLQYNFLSLRLALQMPVVTAGLGFHYHPPTSLMPSQLHHLVVLCAYLATTVHDQPIAHTRASGHWDHLLVFHTVLDDTLAFPPSAN